MYNSTKSTRSTKSTFSIFTWAGEKIENVDLVDLVDSVDSRRNPFILRNIIFSGAKVYLDIFFMTFYLVLTDSFETSNIPV